jgi:hypothetical protein
VSSRARSLGREVPRAEEASALQLDPHSAHDPVQPITLSALHLGHRTSGLSSPHAGHVI